MSGKLKIWGLWLWGWSALLSAGSAQAQLEPFLLLEKPGTGRRIRYYVGDEIEFKLFSEKHFSKGVLVALSDTSFFINNRVEVGLREVEALADRSKVKGVRTVAKTTLLVIPAFFLFSAADNIFNTGNTPIINEEVYALSAVFAAIGGLGFLYNGKRYRLEKAWRIIVVHH